MSRPTSPQPLLQPATVYIYIYVYIQYITTDLTQHRQQQSKTIEIMVVNTIVEYNSQQKIKSVANKKATQTRTNEK